MFLVRFCCANSRDGNSGLDESHLQHAIDPNSSQNIEKKLRLAKNVLVEFMQFEHGLGMKNVDIVKLVEMVLKQSNTQNEVPKKDLQQTYNKLKEINLKQFKKVLTQQYFFTDSTRTCYDFSKVQLVNILYCGGNEAYKANFFFKLVQSSQNGCINNGSTKLLKALEYMTYVTCIVMADAMLKDVVQNLDEDDEIQFEELHELYTTNHLIIKEFAQYINETLLFPSINGSDDDNPRGRRGRKQYYEVPKKYLQLKEFQQLMAKDNLDYTLVRPNEIRQRFTEFVMRNSAQALAEPSQSILQSEGFFNESTIRQSSQRQGGKNQYRDLRALKKAKEQDQSSKLLRSQKSNNNSKLNKSRSKNKGNNENRMLDSIEVTDPNHSNLQDSYSKNNKKGTNLRESVRKLKDRDRYNRQSHSQTMRTESEGVGSQRNLPPKNKTRLNQSVNTRPKTNQGSRYRDNSKEGSDQNSSRYNQQSTGRDLRKGTNRQSVIQSILEESDGDEDDDYRRQINNQESRDRNKRSKRNDQTQSSNAAQKQHKKRDSPPRHDKQSKSKDPSYIKYKYDEQSPALNREGSSIAFNRDEMDRQGGNKSFQDNQQFQKLNEDSLNTSAIDPDTMFQGNLAPSNYYMKNRNSKTMTQRHSNIEKLRKTSRNSQKSFVSSNTKNNESSTTKQYKTLKQFLDDMFSEQFVQFTNTVKRYNGQNHVGEDIILLDRFDQNEQLLTEGGPDDPLPFPKNFAQKYPFQLREVFEYFNAVLRKKELLGFLHGTLYSEKIINMYFKILEKMNLVQLSMDNYQRQQQMNETPDGGRNSVSSNLLMGTNTMKIQYLSTNVVRKLRMQNNMETPSGSIDLNQVDQHLMQYFNHDLILLPFFFYELDDEENVNDNHKHIYQKSPETGEMEALCGCSDDRRQVLVSVKVLDNQVDLFDIEYREHDNHDISNCVLHVMDVASKLQNIELNEELIDADIEQVQGVETDEDMIVTSCYIAECFTFGREPDLENINIEYQRKHIVDVFLSLLSFT